MNIETCEKNTLFFSVPLTSKVLGKSFLGEKMKKLITVFELLFFQPGRFAFTHLNTAIIFLLFDKVFTAEVLGSQGIAKLKRKKGRFFGTIFINSYLGGSL